MRLGQRNKCQVKLILYTEARITIHNGTGDCTVCTVYKDEENNQGQQRKIEMKAA